MKITARTTKSEFRTIANAVMELINQHNFSRKNREEIREEAKKNIKFEKKQKKIVSKIADINFKIDAFIKEHEDILQSTYNKHFHLDSCFLNKEIQDEEVKLKKKYEIIEISIDKIIYKLMKQRSIEIEDAVENVWQEILSELK